MEFVSLLLMFVLVLYMWLPYFNIKSFNINSSEILVSWILSLDLTTRYACKNVSLNEAVYMTFGAEGDSMGVTGAGWVYSIVLQFNY